MKKETPLKEAIIYILGIKSRDFDELSPMSQVGIAKLLVYYLLEEGKGEMIDGLPASFEDYLRSSDIEYTSDVIARVDKIIEDNHLIEKGRLNFASDEDKESRITWALMSNLFDGLLDREIKNGSASYKITQKGIVQVEKMRKSPP